MSAPTAELVVIGDDASIAPKSSTAQPAQDRTPIRRVGARKVLVAVLCAVVVLVVLAPIIWAILTSVKNEVQAVTYPPVFWPDPFSVSAFKRVLTGQNFLVELFNSVLYSFSSVAVALLVGAPAGYAAARLSFKGKDAIMLVILATSMIPTVALLVPIYGLLDRFALVNSAIALITIEAARIAPQTVWFIQAFVKTVPSEIDRAAEIDGASRLRIFVSVVLPLIKPGLAAVFILGLITVWNDYLTVAVFAPDATRRTLQVAIVNQVLDSNGISWSYMMAFVLVASAPVVLMFLATQRWFVSGLLAGGVKG
jgi:multiple sugar transport system permease protein/N,N'-diacetylchitobiose transport system permease protein